MQEGGFILVGVLTEIPKNETKEHSGMAVRLSADLGLHLDVRQYVEAGAINPEEAMIRNLVWWGVFTHDR